MGCYTNPESDGRVTLMRLKRRRRSPWQKKMKELVRGSFIRNVAVMASGTLISQVIVLAALPLLTRLYSPNEYGTYSTYVSVTSILLMIVSLAYENAITLHEDDKVASSVTALSLWLCTGVSLITGIIITVFGGQLSSWMHESSLSPYAALFMLGVWGGGLYQILNGWSIRKKYFRELARTKYTQTIGQIVSQLVLSLIHWGPFGLIAGEVVGRSGGLIPQWRLWRRDVKQGGIRVSLSDLKDVAYRYRRFPQWSLVSNLLNSFGIYLPTLLLAIFYGAHVAGLFALAQRILGSPMTLIMNSVRNVYLAETSEHLTRDPSKLYPLFRKNFKPLAH